ncbi:MAG: bifunctional diguanylate cyclase/phosphodiesterase, partial [Sulfurimicrobium sp.]|nr:bifunctional diguanylate cyclase/phosphodiesterase [Sulfurimicrobium sp.]
GNENFAVMFLDLDRFKYINDTFGHAVGDVLLRQIAEQFRRLDEVDELFVSRFGGDEFVIVESLGEGADPIHTASRFLLLLDQPFSVNDHDFSVTGSVGIAIFPQDGETPEDLLKNADAAMYKAKREGKNNIQLYSADLAQAMSDFYHLEHLLKLAVEKDEFVLHYQPQVDLTSGSVVCVEALLRWNSRENGMIPPLQFIPVAEETGLIRAIGELVFRKACAQWRVWSDQGIRLKMAVNVSPIQFRDDNFIRQLERLLEETHMPPSELEIEITEGVLMGDIDKVLNKLKRLREMGVSIAIDDFGTGYSSLEYLKQLPISSLKIDASFVREIQSSQCDLAIVMTIEALGRNLQMLTVAEGIEEEAQYTLLKGIGCALGQGYFISRPLPAEALTSLLRDGFSLKAVA